MKAKQQVDWQLKSKQFNQCRVKSWMIMYHDDDDDDDDDDA